MADFDDDEVDLDVEDDTPDYADDGWHSLVSARYGWVDAPWQDSLLGDLLEVAKIQCVAYAPALGEDVLAPVNYRVAQLMQTRNLWNASKADPSSGGIGEDNFVVRPYPMDWVVKNILRPKRAVPVVG